MAAAVSIAELRKMPVADLRREILMQEMLIAKLRLGIKLRKEKDSARYRRARREVARMETVLCEKEKTAAGSLPKRPKATTLPPPEKP